jgi:protein TonB
VRAPAPPPPDEPALPIGANDLDLRGFYPDEAKRAGVEGDVVLRVTVEADGTVSRVDVVSHPGFGLDDAAVRALRERLRWKPGKRRGEPVRMTVPFTLHFELY